MIEKTPNDDEKTPNDDTKKHLMTISIFIEKTPNDDEKTPNDDITPLMQQVSFKHLLNQKCVFDKFLLIR